MSERKVSRYHVWWRGMTTRLDALLISSSPETWAEFLRHAPRDVRELRKLVLALEDDRRKLRTEVARLTAETEHEQLNPTRYQSSPSLVPITPQARSTRNEVSVSISQPVAIEQPVFEEAVLDDWQEISNYDSRDIRVRGTNT